MNYIHTYDIILNKNKNMDWTGLGLVVLFYMIILFIGIWIARRKGKDLFDWFHNPSHSTLYPDVLKMKTILVEKQNFIKMSFVYYYKFTNP